MRLNHVRLVQSALGASAAVLLPSAGADVFSWTGDCGTNVWHATCDVGPCGQFQTQRRNNWGREACGTNPAFPTTADDVLIGPGFSVLQNSTATIRSLASESPFTLSSGASTFSIVGAASFNAGLTWTSGTMAGSGTSWLPVGATATLSSTSAKVLSSRLFVSSGQTNWTAGTLSINNTARWRNDGLFEIGASTINTNSNGGTFENTGTLRKLATPPISTVDAVRFYNSGLIDVAGGTLRLSCSSTHSGAIEIAEGATFELGGASFRVHELQPGVSIGGTGTFKISGGRTELNTDLAIPILLLTGGTLAGPGTHTWTNASQWTGGVLAGPGITHVPAGVIMQGPSGYIGDRELINDGEMRIDALTMYAGSVVRNNGTYRCGSRLYGGDTNGEFNNSGQFLFNRPNEPQTTVRILAFNNSGTVDLQAGVLALGSRGQNTGQIHVASEATLILALGPTYEYELGPGTLIDGPGAKQISGRVRVSTDVTLDRLEIDNGYLSGTGSLTVAGPLEFRSGSASVLTIARFVSLGSSTWTGYGDIALDDGALFQNFGVFENRTNSASLESFNDGARFENFGTFRKIASLPDTYVRGFEFLNEGIFEILSGAYWFNSHGKFIQRVGSTFVAAGTRLRSFEDPVELRGGVLSGTGLIEGVLMNTGGVLMPGEPDGTLSIDGDYSQGAAAALRVSASGTGDGQFGRLVITTSYTNFDGAAQLAGAIEFMPADGYRPAPGDEFRVLIANSCSGAINSVIAPPGYVVRAELDPTGVTLIVDQVPTACPADLNGDRTVSLADLAILLAHFGTTGGVEPGDGDLDQDDDVDLADLAGLLSQFGQPCP